MGLGGGNQGLLVLSSIQCCFECKFKVTSSPVLFHAVQRERSRKCGDAHPYSYLGRCNVIEVGATVVLGAAWARVSFLSARESVLRNGRFLSISRVKAPRVVLGKYSPASEHVLVLRAQQIRQLRSKRT